MEKLTCSVAEACDALGVGVTTLYKLINEGYIEAFMLGSRRKIVEQSLRQLVQSLSTNQATTKSRIVAKVREGRRKAPAHNSH